MVNKYVPERGDIVWVSFGKGEGREQRGRRPALVLSRGFFSVQSCLALVCPITSRVKGYPFEVPLTVQGTSCVLLTDQLRTIDWTKRKVHFVERTDTSTVIAAIKKIIVLMGVRSPSL